MFLPGKCRDLRAWKIFRSCKKAWKCYLEAALLLRPPSNLVMEFKEPINIGRRKQSLLTFPENTELTITPQQLFPKLNEQC